MQEIGSREARTGSGPGLPHSTEPAAPKEPPGYGRLSRSLRYLAPYWKLELLALAASLSASILGLLFPWINKIVVDQVVLGKDLDLLRTVCAVLVGAAVIQALLRLLEGYLFASIGERAVVDLRRELLASLLAATIGHHDRLKVGRILSTVTNDTGAMQGLYGRTLVTAFTDGIKLLLTLMVLAWIDWRISLAIVPCLLLFALVVRGFSPRLRDLSRRAQGETAVLSGDLQETLGGIREVKALRREDQELARHDETLRRLRDLGTRRQLNAAAAGAGAESVAMLTMALALFLCGLQVVVGEMQVGVLVAFTHYVGTLFSPVARLTSLNAQVQSCLGSADRVFEILDDANAHGETCGSRALPEATSGDVRIEEVDFEYQPGRTVLHRVSLQVPAGQKVALVGPSGSGKTTLAMLLMGFHAYRGSVTIDGVEVAEIDRRELRARVGVVFQEPFLFDLSVAENLRLGRPRATRDEIETAARRAHAHAFILELPEGYDTRIGERGARLSGGQKQRLAIARLFLLDPRILILDEATSALDAESEALVLEALDRLSRGRTSFVIAHRLSTVRAADRIVVLDRGRVVEFGTHDGLLADGVLYPQLYRRQMEDVAGLTPAVAP